ncbi:MAG TPA: trehalase family glycosidase [Candidatus Saccharimonadales bacterium]|nr:trehalase family glycosidase [Candidatus Saccharimonadales bacterium]
MSETKTLQAQATAVLKANDRGSYTVPAAQLYPHQWLWDSCFIAIGLRHLDVERAKMEILSLLRGQWRNGMMPHMIFGDERGKFADDPGKRTMWRSWLSPYSPDDVATSGITQPPMLAEAVVRIGEKMAMPERRSWYRLVYPALLAYHEWLYFERDPHAEGLALQIHPWETGLDNTPPWMSELHEHLLPWWIRGIEKLHLDNFVGRFRRDISHVPREQRMTNVEALALYDAQRRLRRKNYDVDRILDHSLFAIEDLAFNSILVRANDHLKTIAKTLQIELPSELQTRMALTIQTFDELWDPYTEQYYPRDFVTHKLIKEPSIATLLPLYAGHITKDRAKLLVRMLENEHLFGPPYPIPTTPLNSGWFDSRRYWQGPTWMNTNWLIIDGLERYGFKEHAAALIESSLELVQRAGFYEYFDPINGNPLGSNNFSWTAACVIDWLKK